MNEGPLTYVSGEEIKPGDQVSYDGLPAEIEFVINPRGTPEDRAAEQYNWYMETYGGGVMVSESEVFGRLFLDPADIDRLLVFVERRGVASDRDTPAPE